MLILLQIIQLCPQISRFAPSPHVLGENFSEGFCSEYKTKLCLTARLRPKRSCMEVHMGQVQFTKPIPKGGKSQNDLFCVNRTGWVNLQNPFGVYIIQSTKNTCLDLSKATTEPLGNSIMKVICN